MKKISIALSLIALISLTACGKKEEKKNPIIGKWAYGESFIYTFNEDGTCSYDAAGTMMKCTYTTDGDKLSILYDGNTVPFETTFSIDGNTLNVKDSFGEDTIYKRK